MELRVSNHECIFFFLWLEVLSCLQHVEFKAAGTRQSELSGRLTTGIWKENSGQLRSCSWGMIYEGFHDKPMVLMRKQYTFHETQLHGCFGKKKSRFWPVDAIHTPKASLRINSQRKYQSDIEAAPRPTLMNKLFVSPILYVTWTTGDPSFMFYGGINLSASSHAL